MIVLFRRVVFSDRQRMQCQHINLTTYAILKRNGERPQLKLVTEIENNIYTVFHVSTIFGIL